MAEPVPQAGRFLTGGWYHLVMLNYPVDPEALRDLLPPGTEIDFHDGRTYLSMVGFQFRDTRVLGVPVPGYRDFPEVNLRFYVRRHAPDGWRRGVVFVKEVVPRRLIAWLARTLYNENYVALPMRSDVQVPGTVRYEWWHGGRWHALSATVTGEPQPPNIGSAAEYITEHYWGYVRQRDGSTVEYQVEHPRWRLWPVSAARLDCDVAAFYGTGLASFLRGEPDSAFVAEGSPITVRRGRRLQP